MRIAFAIVALVAFTTLVSAQSTFNCASNTEEPVVPTYEIGLSGTDLSLNVTFNRASNGTLGYDRVEVVFGGNNSCDFLVDFGEANPDSVTVSPNTFWNQQQMADGNCATIYNFVAPINWVLGYCGYTQDNTREAGRTHFLNTIKIKTVQTRDDLRTPYNATREFPFTSDISIATNTTATVTGLQVFGTAYTLNLLGDLKVTVTDNFANDADIPYTYTVSGTVVTSVQWPYRLENSDGDSHANFDNQNFAITGDQYCDAVGDNNTACTQEWDFSFNIKTDVACATGDSGITALTDEWIWMQFIVNCSAQFTGECAPDFAVDPAMNLTLTSSDFCPKSSEISLETDTNTYAFQPAGEDNTAVPSGTAQEWLTETTSSASAPFTQTILGDYVEESIFTYESTLYGEVRVRVADGAATLSTTNITQIRTVPEGDYLTRIVYDADPTGTTVTDFSDASVKVANDNFGAEATYDNNRARFQFQLNNNTFDRNNVAEVAADAAEGGNIQIDLIVTFAEGSTSINDEWSSAVLLQEFVVDNNGKSVPIRTNPIDSIALSQDSGSFTASSNFQLGSNIAPPTVTGQNATAASNALTIGAVAVAGVAIIALVAVVVLRRPEASKPAANLNTLPQSSSFSTVPAQVQMETTASAYNQV